MTVKNLRDAMGQIDENYIAEAIEYRRTSEEVSDVSDDTEEIKSENKNHSVFYVIPVAAACAALVFTVNHFTNPKNIGNPEVYNSGTNETTTITSVETSLKIENDYTVSDVTTADYTLSSVQSLTETENAVTSETNTSSLITEHTSNHTDTVTTQGSTVSVSKETTVTSDITSTVTTSTICTSTEETPPAVVPPFTDEPPSAEPPSVEPPPHEVTTVTSELPVLVEPVQQSVIFDNYSDLSKSFIQRLNDIITDLKNENINVNTYSLEKFRDMTLENNSIIIPAYNGKELPLRDKEGFSNITFYTRELYSKPCFFFHFADGTTNSYIKIYDVSDELNFTGVNNAYDFMKIMNPNPDDNKSDYINLETVNMQGRSVEVVFRTLDNDPRVYANFIYNNSLVILCCSQDKIDSGFLNAFGLADMPLT